MKNIKLTNAGKGLPENRARRFACGRKVFSGLIFCFFSIKRKEVASAAMSGERDR
ncbi:MAG: hypothetical protein ACTHNW_06540 [Mucilaginibacter sp.]